jgi:nucleotide-binding universal stress UspA family protein
MTASLTKLLLAIDGSREAALAVRAAADVSRTTGAELHVVHVFPTFRPRLASTRRCSPTTPARPKRKPGICCEN